MSRPSRKLVSPIILVQPLISNPVTINTFSFNKFKKGDNSDSNQLLNSCNTKPKGTLMAQVQQTI